MTDNEIIKELRSAAEWFTEHGRNTNTAIVGICERAIDHINRQQAEIEKQNEELQFIRQYIHDNGLEWDLLSKSKKSKCGCFQKGERIIGWVNNNPITKTFYFCNGTKERDECSCGGDESKCDFYPNKRNGG